MTQPGDLRLAVGMVGGGPGSNIGIAHRTGLLLDDRYRLVAGSFARDPERSAAMAAKLPVHVRSWLIVRSVRCSRR